MRLTFPTTLLCCATAISGGCAAATHQAVDPGTGGDTAGQSGGSSAGAGGSREGGHGGSQSGGQSGTSNGGTIGAAGNTNGGMMGVSDAGAMDAALVDSGSGIAAKALIADWIGVVGTGQSLSVGSEGLPLLATQQPYKNLKLALNGSNATPPFNPNDNALTLVPLVEPIRPLSMIYPGPYPTNIYGETPHTAMANQLSAIHLANTKGDLVTIHTVVGEAGQGIAMLNKSAVFQNNTGLAYAATLFEVRALARLAKAAGKSYAVGAIVLTHGETDNNLPSYPQDVYQLTKDYNTDLRAITDQKSSIPMIVTQQQGAPGPVSTTALSQLAIDHPGEIVCAGPKYQYNYAPDHLHLTSHEYDRLGEKLAEVFYDVVVVGHAWKPLQPTTFTRAAAMITVNFNVPFPPLNWDEAMPPTHQSTLTEWSMGRGFEVTDANGRVTIKSATINGTSVELALGRALAAGTVTVGYAMATDNLGAQSPTVERRGPLRDSDPFVGLGAATISVRVVQGSTKVQGAVANAFRTVGPRDRAVAKDLQDETIVVAKASDDELTLSKPWSASTGTADIEFQSDHRNYAVSFEFTVN